MVTLKYPCSAMYVSCALADRRFFFHDRCAASGGPCPLSLPIALMVTALQKMLSRHQQRPVRERVPQAINMATWHTMAYPISLGSF